MASKINYLTWIIIQVAKILCLLPSIHYWDFQHNNVCFLWIFFIFVSFVTTTHFHSSKERKIVNLTPGQVCAILLKYVCTVLQSCNQHALEKVIYFFISVWKCGIACDVLTEGTCLCLIATERERTSVDHPHYLWITAIAPSLLQSWYILWLRWITLN